MLGSAACGRPQRITVTNHDAHNVLFSLKPPGSISGSVIASSWEARYRRHHLTELSGRTRD